MTRPMKFALSAPQTVPSASAWLDAIRKIEDLGFETVVVADHFTQGYEVEPMVALTAAAAHTSRLKLQTGVLCNDYRHPVLVHRMAAMLDLISGGRFILGMGAGWMITDYEAAGLTYDRPGVRVSRLEESIKVVKGLFGPEPFSHEGRFYTIKELDGRPKTPHGGPPPIFIGGGSPRVLRLAGREADVVGLLGSLRAGETGRDAIVDMSAERMLEKLEWVRDGLAASGRTLDDIDLEVNNWLVKVTDSAQDARTYLEKIGGRYDVDPDLLAASPSVLVGTVSQCIETLQQRRETFGINYFQLDAGFPPRDLDALAPIVSALAGT